MPLVSFSSRVNKVDELSSLSLSLSLFFFFETKPFLLAFTQKHKDFLKVRQTKPPQSNFNSLEILGSSDFQH
jgi:hypothetical protein